jgi:phenylalanyl-tRNA synthetase beta chain
MLISHNFLKSFFKQDLEIEKICEKLTFQGLEVEKIEKYESIKGSLEGVIIGKVEKVEPHPNADKLKLCIVDIGRQKLNIVCGASNVTEGQKVAVALIGATLYPSNGETLTLKKSKIRGVESEGMICAEDELGLGHSHEGIMTFDTDMEPGTPLAELLQPYTDTLIHIGLTPNRSDAFSHLGVARELACAFRLKIFPPTVQPLGEKGNLDISITLKDSVRCKRYSGLSIDKITMVESPSWLKQQLLALGQRPINIIVDLANWVMFEIGQPLHVFDKSKLTNNAIIVQTLSQDQDAVFTGLDGKTYQLTSQDLLICDGAKPVCIAGVMGGVNSGVTETTEHIFIEAAYFEPVGIRKTSKRLNLFSESAARFAKGTDPNQTLWALERLLFLIQQYCGGRVVGWEDIRTESFEPYLVEFSIEHFWRLGGLFIEETEIELILQSLDIQIVKKINPDLWLLAVPRFRTDVRREQDVFEEILRIKGYEHVPIKDNFTVPFQTLVGKDADFEWQERCADYLAANGFYEIRTNSLVDITQIEDTSIKMLNPLSEETAALRTSMLVSGLEVIQSNINRQQNTLAFFELGNVYWKEKDEPLEKEILALWVAGEKYPLNPMQKVERFSFWDIKKEVEKLLHFIGADYTFQLIQKDNELEWGLFVTSANVVIGKLGAVAKSYLKDLPYEVYYAAIDWQNFIQPRLNKPFIQYREISKFPSVRRDLSLLLTAPTLYQDIEKAILSTNPKIIQRVELFDVYQNNKGELSYAVALTLLDKQKTLTDVEIDKVVTKVIKKLETELQLTVRK